MSQLGYTPEGTYPPYFNITKTETGFIVTIREEYTYDSELCLPMGGRHASIEISEDFAHELYAYLGGCIPF